MPATRTPAPGTSKDPGWTPGEAEADKTPIDHLDAPTYHELLRSLDTATGFEEGTRLDSKIFRADCNHLVSRLKSTRRGLINPRSIWVSRWDLVTSAALLFTATVTPLEVGLGRPTTYDTLFVVNQGVNLIFAIDVVIQFFMPVPDPKTGELLRDRKAIAMKYIKSWFPLDLATILPVDLIEVFGLFGDEGSSGLRSVRLLRVLRLAKLLRMLRASRIIQRWQNAVGLSSTSMSMIYIFVLCAHTAPHAPSQQLTPAAQSSLAALLSLRCSHGSALCARFVCVSVCSYSYVFFIHWTSCIWMMLPQLWSSWRDTPGFPEALIERAAYNTSCTGCPEGLDNWMEMAGPSTSLSCDRPNPCLTPCEIDVINILTTHSVRAPAPHERPGRADPDAPRRPDVSPC